ncbi:hypothetical protein C479_14233 [Halovivax asiaticus JCM 14624]|uniref:Uncharacterized protein n=1 Tax=Halovivax asiaticus JCM 14624 TaxID=1227490 RepID=M0BFV9_9EURY|nr:hypothetical protein [Halovivax asiaticus]ELZ08504.1 hypothetical protein C479_14233 [Halovivax asiaticus JCM 14624]
MTHNTTLKTIGGIALLFAVFLTAALITSGASAAEVANESVTLEDGDDLEVAIEWTDTADAANTSTIEIANETVTVDNVTVDADPGNETISTWVVPDDLVAGNYTVTVDGTSSDINATHVDVFSSDDDGGTIIDDVTGDADPLVSFGAAAMLLGGGVYARREGWL